MLRMIPGKSTRARCGLAAFLLATSACVALAGANPVSETAHQIFKWRPFLAPFHAVVLHFPIGFITMAFLLEVYQWRRPSEDLRRVTGLTIWLSLFAGLTAASLGLLRAAGGGYDSHSVEVHRMAGLAVPVLTIATLISHRFSTPEAPAKLRHTYRSLLVATVLLLVLAGHYGGNLTHGSKYLVENAPQFVRELLAEPPAGAGATAGPRAGEDGEAGGGQGRFFAEKIKPILEAKCLRCHGTEKQKGGYRLDLPGHALKGGQSGKAAIVPGKPAQSHLVELILEKPGSDDIMPPGGKEPLTRDEIMAIIEWVRDGAAFGGSRIEGPASGA